MKYGNSFYNSNISDTDKAKEANKDNNDRQAKKDKVTSDALNFLKMMNQPKRQLSEEEKKAQEEKEVIELESAINEEIRWAMEEKKRLEGERDKRVSGKRF